MGPVEAGRDHRVVHRRWVRLKPDATIVSSTVAGSG
jgi:hypothetical protein